MSLGEEDMGTRRSYRTWLMEQVNVTVGCGGGSGGGSGVVRATHGGG